MIKIMKKYAVLLVAFSLVIGSLSVSTQAEAKFIREIIVAKISGNTLKYHQAIDSSEIFVSADWQNTVGYGKKMTIKISPKAKYYLLDIQSMQTYKVSKKKFIKSLYDYSIERERGVTYYIGMACKMTIKNGKCVKLVQEFQP